MGCGNHRKKSFGDKYAMIYNANYFFLCEGSSYNSQFLSKGYLHLKQC